MPKSAKKRKEKAADFSKAKLKLGKGKQNPSNVIDTSFKARSIALPTQSITKDRDRDAPTTNRGLTFIDLVNHTKHYSPSVRRDALHSIRELFTIHADSIEPSLSSLINACTRLIVDEDAGVRKSLCELFSWLLPQVAQENIVPHAPTLLLFATSAQTHIFPEIRLDAVRYMDILIDRIPDTVIEGWDEGKNGHGARILEGYLGSLNAGTAFSESHGSVHATSTASVILTASSKLVVLQSLASFLRHALSVDALLDDDSPYTMPFSSWYLQPSFKSQEAHDAFDDLIRPRLTLLPQDSRFRQRWQKEVDTIDDDPNFIGLFPIVDIKPVELLPQHLSDGIPQNPSDNQSVDDSKTTLILRIARALRGTLISTFLDFAPSVFSPNGKPPETDVKLVVTVANIARSLYSAVVRRTSPVATKDLGIAQEDLRMLLNYMAPYFPFSSTNSRDIKVEEAMLEMNLIYCELASLLVLGFNPSSNPSTKSTSSNSTDKSSIHAEPVNDYVIKLLRGEPVDGARLTRSLTPSAYQALLPTIWSFLNNTATLDSQHLSTSILQATLTHATQTPSKSSLKKLTIEFVGRIVLLDTERMYDGTFRLARGADEQAFLEDWVNHLPKVLWELGTSNLAASEVILRFLIRFLQRRSKLINTSTLTFLRSRLVPYFCIDHPVRGRMLGPFTKLPTDTGLRNLALDLVVAIQMNNGVAASAFDSALEDAVGLVVAGSTVQSYWDAIRHP